MLRYLKRRVDRMLLRDPAFAFLFEPDTTGELVALDTETTGLDPWVDDIVSIAAVKIRGNTILTSERLELLIRPTMGMSAEAMAVHQLRPMDLRQGMTVDQGLDQLLRFVGSRPLVGYYVEFDVTMINKYLLDRLGISLPNRIVEVSGMFYDMKFRENPGRYVDLRFNTIVQELDLPVRAQHDALNDALLAAMMYLKLKRRRNGARR